MTMQKVVAGIVGVLGLITLTMNLACSDDRTPSSSNGDGCPKLGEFVPVEQIAAMTYYEEPDYPRLAEQAGLEGLVWIAVQVNRQGQVTEAVIYKSCGVTALDYAALAVAPKCRFEPGLVHGRPVCTWVTYKVEFKLE